MTKVPQATCVFVFIFVAVRNCAFSCALFLYRAGSEFFFRLSAESLAQLLSDSAVRTRSVLLFGVLLVLVGVFQRWRPIFLSRMPVQVGVATKISKSENNEELLLFPGTSFQSRTFRSFALFICHYLERHCILFVSFVVPLLETGGGICSAVLRYVLALH